MLTAICDAESRVRFPGYSVTQHRLFAFVLPAMMAGLAGALDVPQLGIINPGELRAVTGPNGAGKARMMGAITGRPRPTVGTASFVEVDLTRMRAPASALSRRAARYSSS